MSERLLPQESHQGASRELRTHLELKDVAADAAAIAAATKESVSTSVSSPVSTCCASSTGADKKLLLPRRRTHSPDAGTAAHSETTSTAVVGKKHIHVGGFSDASISHVYDALVMVDPETRQGWERAKQCCSPAVLEHEACPCYFLAVCQSNPWEAASRICNYWNERIEFFQDRAFEALTIGSDDAEPTGLSKTDVAIVETGCMQLLPSDRQGRSVYFLNESLLSRPELYNDAKGRIRAHWYILQKAYTSGEVQAHRIVTIIQMVRPPLTGYNLKYCAACMRLAAAVPIHVEDIHLLSLPATTGTGRILQFAISTCFNVMRIFSHLIKVHHGAVSECGEGKAKSKNLEPPVRLMQQLRQHGLTKRCLPEGAGGVLNADSFQIWLKKQQRKEQQLFWSAAQRAQRRRDINRMHSRRKRQRRRQEFEELQDQARQLEEANERARAENFELQELLHNANLIVRDAELRYFPDGSSSGYESMRNLAALHGDSGASVTLGDPLSSVLAALEPDPIPRSRFDGPTSVVQDTLVRGYEAVFGDFDPSAPAVVPHRNRQIPQLPADPSRLRSNALEVRLSELPEPPLAATTSAASAGAVSRSVENQFLDLWSAPDGSTDTASAKFDWELSQLLLLQEQGLRGSEAASLARFGASLRDGAANTTRQQVGYLLHRGHPSASHEAGTAQLSFLQAPAATHSLLSATARTKVDDAATESPLLLHRLCSPLYKHALETLPLPLASDPPCKSHQDLHAAGREQRPSLSLSSYLWNTRRPSGLDPPMDDVVGDPPLAEPFGSWNFDVS